MAGAITCLTLMLCLLYILAITPIQSAGGLIGGLSVADSQDSGVQAAAQYAVTEINRMRNSMYLVKLLNVVEAQTQVVNGALYHLTLEIGHTKCRKGRDEKQIEGCDVNHDKSEVCKVKVLQDPVTSKYSLSSQPACKYRALLGGEKDVDDEREAEGIAHYAVQQLNAKSNRDRKDVLLSVKSATKQLVAGVLYKLKFTMAESRCKNDAEISTAKECPVAKNGKVHECDVEVWVQVWLVPKNTLHRSVCTQVGGGKGTRIKRTPNIISSPQHKLLGGDGHDIGNFGSFREFMQKFNKTYESDEEMKYRFTVFRHNMKRVVMLTQAEQGPKDLRGRYGATVFSDLTESEFRLSHLSPLWEVSKRPPREARPSRGEGMPEAFDWREHGAVTGVKNQGMCGSCWAFSTTGNIEGQWFLKKKKLVSLSEQELVDCDKVDEGCNGGLPSQAYEAIERLGGLETEAAYPYKGSDQKCKFSRAKARVYINDSLAISKNETEMAAWLLRNGPISIGINAMAMQFYFGGISHPWKAFCDPQSLDHGVLIVGYGVGKSWFGHDVPYWIIKNSWGTWWGEDGYYRIYRGDGVCGLNQMATSAVIE